MFQKNLGWFMTLGRNHVRLGSSTWCTPQTRQKLAVSTKFHFDFGHSKAAGFSVPLFPAWLNLQRASHKVQGLSHKTPSLGNARPSLYFNVSYGLPPNNYSLRYLNWSKPPKGRNCTLFFLSFARTSPCFIYFRWLAITGWSAQLYMCIIKACTTIHHLSIMG